MFHQWQTIWNFYFFWKHIKQTIVKNSSQNIPSLLQVITGLSLVTDAIDSGDDGMGSDVTSVIWDDGSDDVILEVVNSSNCEEAKAC